MGRFDPTMHKRLAILVASDLALGIFAPNEVKAQQASASSIQQDGAASGGGESGGKDDTGQDFTNPQNLFQLRYQYRTAPGTDLNGNDFSFAGDPTKKNISNLQLWPMLNINLPDHWFFTLYPSADIRVNYGDPVTGQTGRLFLPFDFS